MAIPGGAVSRAAGTINHFFPDIDPYLSRIFIRSTAEVNPLFNKVVHRMTIKGAYGVFQGFYDAGDPSPMNRGEGITDGGFDEFSKVIYPHQYKTDRIPIHRSDQRDSQAPVKPSEVAQQQMKKLATYENRILAELLVQSATTYLHPDTDFTTWNGSASLFSSSHSFNGQTLDNSVAGTGSTASAWIDDWYSVKLARNEMPDDHGNPYWGEEAEENVSAILIAPPEREQQLAELMKSELIVQAGATAPSTHYSRDAWRGQIESHLLNRLTDNNNWFVLFVNEGDNLKPFVFGEKEAIRREEWKNQTSDWAKRTQQEGERYLREFGVINGSIHHALTVTNA